MTLLAIYNSEGCIGRCDARCYDAEEPDCDCVCGGMNHGVGRPQAVANAQAPAEQWVKEFEARTGQTVELLQISTQMELPL